MLAIVNTETGKELIRFERGSVGYESDLPDLDDPSFYEFGKVVNYEPPREQEYKGSFQGAMTYNHEGYRWELVKVSE